MLSRKRYVRAIRDLREKTVLVGPRVRVPGQVMVQFEEPSRKGATVGSSPRRIFTERSARRSTLKRAPRWPVQVPSNVEPQYRDKLVVRGEEPQPGPPLISPRRGYRHHGIYVGGGKVVHYAGVARGQFRGRTEWRLGGESRSYQVERSLSLSADNRSRSENTGSQSHFTRWQSI